MYRMGSKQYSNNQGIIYGLPSDLFVLALKRVSKMAEAKFVIMLSYIVGVPLGILGIVTNMDSWKSTALFIVMMVYWMGMVYFRFRRQRRLERKEEMELKDQALDLWYREQEKLKSQAPSAKK